MAALLHMIIHNVLDRLFWIHFVMICGRFEHSEYICSGWWSMRRCTEGDVLLDVCADKLPLECGVCVCVCVLYQ